MNKNDDEGDEDDVDDENDYSIIGTNENDENNNYDFEVIDD